MRLVETLAFTPALCCPERGAPAPRDGAASRPRRAGALRSDGRPAARAREFSRILVWRCFCLATVLLIDTASGQNLLPNPSFQEGRDSPTGWRPVGASGRRI